MRRILLTLTVLCLLAGCEKKETSDKILPKSEVFSHYQDENGKVTVVGINVANLLDESKVTIIPAKKWKTIEAKIKPGEKIDGQEFPKLDMTLKELVSVLGPAYHKNEPLQIFHWYFSDGRALRMVGIYLLDQKPASISIEKYDSKTFR